MEKRLELVKEQHDEKEREMERVWGTRFDEQ